MSGRDLAAFRALAIDRPAAAAASTNAATDVENGFSPEQHRLRLPIDTGHPGAVYRSRQPFLIAAQARDIFGSPDFAVHVAVTNLAAAVNTVHDGPAFVETLI